MVSSWVLVVWLTITIWRLQPSSSTSTAILVVSTSSVLAVPSLEKEDQFEKGIEILRELGIKALVIIGGDDSNTNACVSR